MGVSKTCKSDDDDDSSTSWTMQISRGRLKLVNSNSYRFFVAVETKLRQLLRLSSAEMFSTRPKSGLIEGVCSDDDVQFFLSILGAEWSRKEEECLLQLIVDLWITIRGLSFARSFMELYKQNHKKTVEKSKGLRKKLNT